jgi:hypothetical protein
MIIDHWFPWTHTNAGTMRRVSCQSRRAFIPINGINVSCSHWLNKGSEYCTVISLFRNNKSDAVWTMKFSKMTNHDSCTLLLLSSDTATLWNCLRKVSTLLMNINLFHIYGSPSKKDGILFFDTGDCVPIHGHITSAHTRSSTRAPPRGPAVYSPGNPIGEPVKCLYLSAYERELRASPEILQRSQMMNVFPSDSACSPVRRTSFLMSSHPLQTLHTKWRKRR